MTRPSPSGPLIIVLAALGACIVAVAVSLTIIAFTESHGDQSPIAGDPGIYEGRIDEIFDGGVPYVDSTLEHLPASVVPMVVVSVAAMATDISYTFLWAVAMTVVFVATVWLWSVQSLPFPAGTRFLMLSLPLLPLALYRVEPWVVLLASVSIVLALHKRWIGSAAMTVVATLAKGWPLVLLAYPWRAGRRVAASLAAVVSLGLLGAVSMMPGFRDGRAFTGIHSETIVGNLVLVGRHLTGSANGIDMTAGAAYVDVASVAVLLNLAIGGWFLLRGAIRAMRSYPIEHLVVPLGLATVGIVLASPLLSTQFIIWLVPFVMFLDRPNRWLFVGIGIVSLVSIIWWDPSSAVWAATILVRNVMLVALAVLWYRGTPVSETRSAPASSEHVA